MSIKAHHRYKTTGGKFVPGVTTVSGLRDKSGQLVRWANQLGLKGIDAETYRDETADIGTLSHARIVADLSGENERELFDDYSPNIVAASDNSMLSYYEWKKKHELQPIAVEKVFVSDSDLFGGTWDFYGLLDGHKTLIDFKTGNDIYFNHLIQLGGYSKLAKLFDPEWEKELDILTNMARIVNIPRQANEFFKEVCLSNAQLNWCYDMFGCLLDLYWLEKDSIKEGLLQKRKDYRKNG